MAHYVSIDIDKFSELMQTSSFVRTIAYNEIVFERVHDLCPELKIKVYSSFKVGEGSARDCGADAIRVVAIFDNGTKSFGVYKGARVYRTTSQESVHERVVARIDEAFARCNEWLNKYPKPLAKASSEIGNVMKLVVKVIDRKHYPNRNSFLFIMTDLANSRKFIYWTERDVLKVDKTYDIRCKVKALINFNGEKQTELTECFGKEYRE
jgi:hypothetical protein